jgi:hypothetical protein
MKLSEAMTLLAKLGGGLGVAERDDEDLGVDVSSLPTDANGNFILDGLHLTDVDETFLVGLEEFNYDDLEDAYAWIDAELRLSARLTRALTGRVSWRRRETTDDFIGAFYAEIGDAASREDLFDYPLRENWVESNLTYRLLHPALTLFAGGGINLTSESTRFPNERASFWNGGFAWGNPAGTLRVRGAVGGDSYQLFHPSIPGDGERDLLFVGGRIEYSPVHGRWLVRLDVDRASTSGVKSELTDDDALTLFTDEQDRTRTTLILSRKLGQKWRAQIRLRTDSRLDGPREIAWLLERDLHDAVGVLRVRARRDVRRAESRSDNPTDVDVTVGLRFKLPEGAIETGTGDISTLIESLRAPAIAN